MNALGVTITGQRFDHMVYHFVLTYSNWESVTVCASESFEALSDGLQNALWELGGVPTRHRSDSLSAAVNNLSATREFQTRYRDLLAHYGLSGQRINVRQAHENGDAESSHGHFKTAVEQALLLRGSRDFASREEYGNFLQQIVATRNSGRHDRFTEELRSLRDLPDTRLSSCLKVRCRVDSQPDAHSSQYLLVHSRLCGEWVRPRSCSPTASRSGTPTSRLIRCRWWAATNMPCTIGMSSIRWCKPARLRITRTATIYFQPRVSASLTIGFAKAATNAAAPRTT
jgi:hypothetical protein